MICLPTLPTFPPYYPATATAFALQLIMASSVQDCVAGPEDKPSVQFLIISGSSWAGTDAMSNLLRRLEDPHQASQQQRQANKATCVAHTDWGRQRGRCFGLMITIKQRAQRRASMSRVGPVCASVSVSVCVCLCCACVGNQQLLPCPMRETCKYVGHVCLLPVVVVVALKNCDSSGSLKSKNYIVI